MLALLLLVGCSRHTTRTYAGHDREQVWRAVQEVAQQKAQPESFARFLMASRGGFELDDQQLELRHARPWLIGTTGSRLRVLNEQPTRVAARVEHQSEIPFTGGRDRKLEAAWLAWIAKRLDPVDKSAFWKPAMA
jgi:hypothetical protein